MRAVALFAALCVAGSACAQTADPAYEPLARAYNALKARDYDNAIDGFLKAIELAPERSSIRKDLGYAYLRIGENELAREQFHEAMRLEPDDTQVALEYAFLCYETKQQAEARRIFDRIRKTGNLVAEQAFHNIDDPLAAALRAGKMPLRRAPTTSMRTMSWQHSPNSGMNWSWRPSIMRRPGAFIRTGARC
jgi:Tfp pilus assembly protein PilF